MSNNIFLWIFSCGLELGVIVLCLLPLRMLLRKKVPRVFSYFLWCTLPMNILYNLWMLFGPVKIHQVVVHIHKEPQIVLGETITQILKWCWICGTIAVVFGMLYSYFRFMRCLVGSIRLKENIYLAERIQSPFSLGVLFPKIFLPTSLSKVYYEPVILHERVHIARKDIWVKYLAVCFLGFFWFQPLLWYAYRLFINDMEEACDETVLKRQGAAFRAEYAMALVEVSFQAGKVQGAAIGYRNGEIKGRIKNIMNYEKTRFSVRMIAVCICILFMIATIPLAWEVPRVVQMEQQNTVGIGGAVIRETGMKINTITDDN